MDKSLKLFCKGIAIKSKDLVLRNQNSTLPWKNVVLKKATDNLKILATIFHAETIFSEILIGFPNI